MTIPLAPPRPAVAPAASGEDGAWAPLGAGLVLERGRLIASKYVLERPAGFGGMAHLWVATNQATGAEVCVKLLVLEEGDGHEEAVARFRREAHAAASLSHRAIVRVFDLLELDEDGAAASGGDRTPHAYAIVMELLQGETLGDVLAKRGSIPVEEALDLFLPVVSALGHAHRAAVIHRDLKPDNIFLATEPDGHVIPKVLDFGVSKVDGAAAITVDGVVVGTPSFMSPEQAKGSRRIDARSDVFSAGILLYMMLSGRNPFEDAPTFAETVDAVVRRRLPPIADLAPPIWSVIERATAKDPAGRFGDATELGIALRKASGRRSTSESDPNAVAPAPSSSRRVVEGAAEAGAAADDADAASSGAALTQPVSDAARRRRLVVA
ncbi:MAG: serine/threonine protein kinase, partial [Labilithrix sp.]|nr:serine/threonine protein kinase [Labilithrix sp.]